MWVHCTNSATKRLYNEELMDEPVEFGDSSTVQVPADVGEAMVEHYDAIKEHSTDD